MSMNTMAMAPTFPEGDILDALHDLEERVEENRVEYAGLIYDAYHRGRRAERICCMAYYMNRCKQSYEEAERVFSYPLVQSINLKEAVLEYYERVLLGRRRERLRSVSALMENGYTFEEIAKVLDLSSEDVRFFSTYFEATEV